jgi:hypothetical protein
MLRHSAENSGNTLTALAGRETPHAEIEAGGGLQEGAPLAPATPLSTTDLISRQLFSEYVGISKNGQSTPLNLQSLGNKYAENILNRGNSLSSRTVSREDLTVTDDSPAAISQYEKQMSALRAKYAALAKGLGGEGKIINDIDDPSLQKLFATAANLYVQAAEEFERVRVPASFLPSHIAIVNNHWSSAEVLRKLAENSEDPLKLYSVIKKQVENQQEEEELFRNMQAAFRSYGIPSSTSL